MSDTYEASSRAMGNEAGDSWASFPASFGQERLWFLEQYDPDTSVYNLPTAFRLRGDLDRSVLERCLGTLIERHESLRTRFAVDGDRLVQIVDPPLPVALAVIDVSGHPDPTRETDRVLEEEAVRPFDLEHGPLVRAGLVRVAPREHVLYLTFHHIIVDGWSIDVLTSEVAVLYEAFIHERPSPLPELSIQYGDFAVWQRERLVGPELERLTAHWRQALAGASPHLELAGARRRGSSPTHRAGAVRFELGGDLTARVRALGARCRATTFMVLAATSSALLHRHSLQEDLSFGYPIANRNHEQLEAVVGFLVNTLVLRTRPHADQSFISLLEAVRVAVLDADAHQDLPFDVLAKAAAREQTGARSSPFRVMLVLQNTPPPRLDVSALSIEALPDRSYFAKFDLTLSFIERPDGIHGVFEYDADLFDHATVVHLSRQFEALLRDAVTAPETSIGALSLVNDAELEAFRLASCDALPDLGAPGCLHELFEERVRRAPEKIAVVFEGTTLTYGDLDARANQLAHLLVEWAGDSAAPIAICVQRSLGAVIGILGILKAGRAYVPIDPEYPEARVRFVLADCGATLLLSDEATLARIPELEGNGQRVLSLDADATRSELARRSRERRQSDAAPERRENPAYVIYTSGSTGAPKGCVVSHRNVTRLFGATGDVFGFDEHDVWTLFHSIAFDFSVWEIWGALLHGGRLVVVPHWVTRSAHELVDLLVAERVTVLNQTPTFFKQLAVAAEDRGGLSEAALRYVIFGGEKLECSHLRRWIERYGDHRPRLVNMYGITETTVHVTVREIFERDLDVGGSFIGHPLRDLRVYVLDREGRPVPVGIPGELYVAGAGVSGGYLSRPELTAARFVAPPWDPSSTERLYRTGDIARRHASGDLEFIGRADTQVKIRGFRVELGEIEAALGSLAGIEAAAVRIDESWESPLLAAYVVPADGSLLSDQDARDAFLRTALDDLRRRLPGYMVPARVALLSALPLTTNGKLDVSALPNAAPVGDRVDGYVAPTTNDERTLVAIWESLLGASRIGTHDDFFQLGGDSIVSLQVVSRARRAGIEITPRALFENPTIAGVLSARSDRAASEETDAAIEGGLTLLPIQRWFFDTQPVEAVHHFVFWSLLHVTIELSADGVRELTRAILARHDALRLRFVRSVGGIEATHAPLDDALVDRGFALVDCSELPAASYERAIEVHLRAALSSFDLSRAPLFKIVWYRGRAGERPRLAIIAHHLVVDGVSWRVLLEDIASCVTQLSECRGIALAPKSTSYRWWAARLAAYAGDHELLAEREHWRSTLRAVRTLPVDSISHADRLGDVRSLVLTLAREETSSLLVQCPRAYQTQINDLLLSAVLLAVRRWAGLESIVLDLEGHGREDLFGDADVSQTIGWFTSKFPVHLRGPGDGSWEAGAVIRRVKETLRLLPRRGVGYGVLRYLAADPDLEQLEASRPVPMCFNYLGQWSSLDHGEHGRLLQGTGSIDTSSSSALRSQYLVDINGFVVDGVMTFEIAYSEKRYAEATMQRFVEDLGASLRAVIDACVSASCAHERDVVEERYPATPMQRGMSFHTLASDASAYVVQYRYALTGVDADAWREALRLSFERHPVLRTSFVECETRGLLQVVRADVAVPWRHVDLRGCPAAEIESLLREDAEAPFLLDVPPLVRWSFCQTSNEEAIFTFTFHHALLDGWSVALVVDELRRLYDGERDLPLPVPYRAYVDWLEAQDLDAARTYWRRTLEGVGGTTWSDQRSSSEVATRARANLTLDSSATRALSRNAADLGTTLNTMVQAALAMALARTCGTSDVVFGVTTSGRHAAIADVERIVGPLITTVPMRVPRAGTRCAREWLRALMLRQLENDEFSYLALPEIHRCSGLGARAPLFDTLLVFQNYPVSSRATASGWSMVEDGGRDETHYDVTLVATPGAELDIEICYREARVSEARIQDLSAHLSRLFEALATVGASWTLDEVEAAAEALHMPAPHRVADGAGQGLGR